eukprot:1117707-Alexandrium_andersonii.AAC.1
MGVGRERSNLIGRRGRTLCNRGRPRRLEVVPRVQQGALLGIQVHGMGVRRCARQQAMARSAGQ